MPQEQEKVNHLHPTEQLCRSCLRQLYRDTNALWSDTVLTKTIFTALFGVLGKDWPTKERSNIISDSVKLAELQTAHCEIKRAMTILHDGGRQSLSASCTPFSGSTSECLPHVASTTPSLSSLPLVQVNNWI